MSRQRAAVDREHQGHGAVCLRSGSLVGDRPPTLAAIIINNLLVWIAACSLGLACMGGAPVRPLQLPDLRVFGYAVAVGRRRGPVWGLRMSRSNTIGGFGYWLSASCYVDAGISCAARFAGLRMRC